MSKGLSPTTVLFRTILTRTITLYEKLIIIISREKEITEKMLLIIQVNCALTFFKFLEFVYIYPDYLSTRSASIEQQTPSLTGGRGLKAWKKETYQRMQFTVMNTST